MSISYNLNIPDGPNNPSNDQPKMKVNTNSINSWTAIDHVEFAASPAGSHKQVTFSSKNTPGAQTDPQSVLYTGNGTASSVAQLFLKNQNGILPISPIVAFGVFTTLSTTGAPTPITLSNGYNVASISQLGNVYTITLNTGITTGNNVITFIDVVDIGSLSRSFSGGVLTVNGKGTTQNKVFNFLILQI